MKRIALLLLTLGCGTALAVSLRIPQLIRLQEDLRPIFDSLGVTNQPVIVGQGTILRGTYRAGNPDGFSLDAPLLEYRPAERDGTLPRLTQGTNSWVYASFIPAGSNASILVRFEYGVSADTNIIEKIKAVVERHRTATASTVVSPAAGSTP